MKHHFVPYCALIAEVLENCSQISIFQPGGSWRITRSMVIKISGPYSEKKTFAFFSSQLTQVNALLLTSFKRNHRRRPSPKLKEKWSRHCIPGLVQAVGPTSSVRGGLLGFTLKGQSLRTLTSDWYAIMMKETGHPITLADRHYHTEPQYRPFSGRLYIEISEQYSECSTSQGNTRAPRIATWYPLRRLNRNEVAQANEEEPRRTEVAIPWLKKH
jgi:hypothetical protein